ncbi:MAG: alkaline phosphatase family protein, partial [Verrucomicrobiota bacterium]
ITLRLDRQLADFFSYLDQTIGLTNTAIVLTADHGVAPTVEFAKQQGLDAEGADETKLMGDLLEKLEARFGPGNYLLKRKFFYGQLYFDHKALLEKNLQPAVLAEFIREWAFATGKFHAAFTRAELLSGQASGLAGKLTINGFNGERSGDIALVYKPYILNSAVKTGTTHFSPFSYDTHVPVLFYGSQFRAGRYPDEFYITDIVPTLSSVLRIDVPAGCMGKPFVKVLEGK